MIQGDKTNYKRILALSQVSPVYPCPSLLWLQWNTYLRIILKKVRYINIWAGAVQTVFSKTDFCKVHFGIANLKAVQDTKAVLTLMGGQAMHSLQLQCWSEPGIAGLSCQDVRHRGPSLGALWSCGGTMCVCVCVCVWLLAFMLSLVTLQLTASYDHGRSWSRHIHAGILWFTAHELQDATC